MVRWIFVTGGVLSGLGKGLIVASVARLIQSSGLKVVPVKCDGYLNVDPGTMNPIEHGEVFVLADGGEVDMDFGHYERFLGIETKAEWNLTAGKVFGSVIEQEREGVYLGKTVQIIPHVTDEIKSRLRKIAEEEGPQVMIVEVGGTIGDIENQIFLEAIRQMRREEKGTLIHLTLVPELNSSREQKTKPTQHSVRALESFGLWPDIIVCRSPKKLEERSRNKIALFAGVRPEFVFSDPDLESVYEIPLLFERQKFSERLFSVMGLTGRKSDVGAWRRRVEGRNRAKRDVRVLIAGKYTEIADSYVSILEALNHAGARLQIRPDISWIETSEEIDQEVVKKADCVIIPGGFGGRGTAGKADIVRYCREGKIPILGLCYGMQLMCIEAVRTLGGRKKANSTEIDPKTPDPVIVLLPDQEKVYRKGGTMRLGAYVTTLERGSKITKIYGRNKITERFRHRWEVNPEYHKLLEDAGVRLSGWSEDGSVVQVIEREDHPFFVGTQFHPEYTSKFIEPHPLFVAFLEAGVGRSKKKGLTSREVKT